MSQFPLPQINRLLFSLMAFVALFFPPFSYGAIPKIEVLIGKSIPQIVIKGENLTKTYFAPHQINSEHEVSSPKKESKTYPGKNTLVLNCETSLKEKWSKGILVAELSSTSGVIEWKNEIFKGDLNVIRQPDKKSCHLVQALSLEHYISTLLGKEMNRNWPIEALKAQAVAARSYALHKMRLRKQKNSDQTYYDLESSEKDQVNGSLSDINSNTIKATSLTEGEVLLNDQKKLDPVFYHAQCGGKTLLPQDVWHEKVANYKKVKCSFCQTTTEGIWKRDLSLPFFLGAIKQKSRKLVKIDDKSKYSEKLRLYFSDGMLEMEKEEFRRLFGKSLIRSNRFSVTFNHQRIFIQGQGLGHGVGLCQLGALDLAKKGLNYKQILKYYYPSYELSKIYGKSFDQM